MLLDGLHSLFNYKKKLKFPTRFVKLQHKISKSINALEYFTCRSWNFTNENLFNLAKAINVKDNKV